MRSHWPRASRLTGVRAVAFTFAAGVPLAVAAQTPPTPAQPAPSAPAKPGPLAEEKPTKVTLDLRVTPAVSFSPARIRASAELKVPDDRMSEFYCAAVEWDWGDLTESEESNECEPYEAGVSDVTRRRSPRVMHSESPLSTTLSTAKCEARRILSGLTVSKGKL